MRKGFLSIRRTIDEEPGGLPFGKVTGFTVDTTETAGSAPPPPEGDHERIGRIAAAFAQTIGSLLTPALGRTERILSRQTRTPETVCDLESIHRASEQAASIIYRLLSYACRSPLRPQLLDLNALISGLVPRILAGIGSGVDFETRLAPGIRRVNADPVQAERLLLDLVANACEAMPREGRLVVETAAIEVDRLRLRHGVKIAPGSYAALTVRDTGVGMDAITRARAFDPFFSTKPGAPGLGLSSAYGFVKQSGGYIWIDGAPGRGALATVYLPCGEPEGAGNSGSTA